MSLLSKAEVQYLQGQKQVSRSYERKLKCIIKKKVEGLKKDLLLASKIIPIEQIFGFEDIVNVRKAKADQEPSTKISNPPVSENDATRFSSTTKDNHPNLSTNPHILENLTSFDNDKLYNCHGDIHQTKRRVRSVVRISRRSSEPQVMGSKPTGPV